MARIRRVAAQDKPLVAALFDALGDESRRRRFFVPKRTLRDDELVALTELDRREHEALLALDAATGRPLGVARYIRVPGRGSRAEVAVAVADGDQRRGVGEALLARLVELARRAGVRRLTAVVLSENVPARRLLARFGATLAGLEDGGYVSMELALRRTPMGLLRLAMRRARRAGRSP